MATPLMRPATGTAICLLMSLPVFAGAAIAQEAAAPEPSAVVLETVVLSAEDQNKQALGASVITESDLAKAPVVNDISEIVRKMPGVNLTGNNTSGQRGNNRQIDIRGMGPENTLILIDGKPVMSRNAVKMSRGGERDTRGDSNWVPAEMIERIEVLRGPAAARYGSGSAGGVVNIITKRPETLTGQVSMHTTQPESSKEGATNRTNFMLAGPAGEDFTFRIFGNYNRSEPDSADINPAELDDDGEEVVMAGTEGVINKDISTLLTWHGIEGHEIDLEWNFSRQGNLYAGDTRTGVTDEQYNSLLGEETNRMYRNTLAITHRGEYGFGESNSYLQWENTRNSRLCSGLSGGPEDSIDMTCVDTDGDGEDDAPAFQTITLDNVTAKSEWILPMTVAKRASRVTFGAEYRGEFMDDPHSIANEIQDDGVAEESGVDADPANRDPSTQQNTIGLYAEANIEWSDQLTLTPGLRFDYNDNFGSNWSPSLNAEYAFNDSWTLKLGVARAFKTPNLFQLNPNYVYRTRGNGCPYIDGEQVGGPCYVLGNPDLEAERSWNKEIGVAYQGQTGINGSLTFFHNDYDNRIGSGTYQYNDGAETNRLYRWENQKNAVISGIEGNFSTPLGDRFAFNANFTKMIKSEMENGQPLSLVPDYTINSSLDWFATDAITVTLAATHYGEIEATSVNPTTGADYEDPDSRDPYTLVNLGGTWDMSEQARLSAGISNLFDKTVLRTDSGEGANTFNEPGRAFYMTLTSTF
ncbi:FepA family TonB-dependent siderophore receptor [Paracoccus sp. MBLB3053]|uniref:FepA family TonB-dependent siderophore receptor n=1 Tax=Paracoccus aurantius TaxID=3073814 RepID=A0ABU2HWE9_9RHOB|nr:FepA family TonB-dependent siderophore receptor [Paracoccus sp. MBLB3053]MDS9468840.1 FepA family TonB-dependent siderophore receptor [Paracoccus sp. MBLB3053]